MAERRQDLRFGLLASIVVNAFGGETAPADFFPEQGTTGPLDVEQWDEGATLAIARQMIENARRNDEDRTADAGG